MEEPNKKEAKAQATRKHRGRVARWTSNGKIAYRFLLGGLLERLAKLVGVLAGWLDKLA